MYLEKKYNDFRARIRDFAERVIGPHVARVDETGVYPKELFDAMGKEGYLGMVVPKEYGGTGFEFLEYVIAVEELSRVCGSTGLSVAAHNGLGCSPIVRFGSEAQKKKYLPEVASGKKIASFGLTEPQGGSDAGNTQTTAARVEGGWKITGTKCWITNASFGEVFNLTARSDPKSIGPKGISAFIIERGWKGFSSGRKENKMGLRGSDTAFLHLDEVFCPEENLLGPEGNGFKQFMMTLDTGRIAIGGMAVGLAQGAFDVAARYAKERHAFGQPISTYQAIQWKLADMAVQIEAARHLVYHAARMRDMGLPLVKEAAMAKLFSSEAVRFVTYEAIQVLGGFGYSSRYPVERMYRDMKLCEIGEGTSEIQRIVIAREVLKQTEKLFGGMVTEKLS
ncbi:MAG: acyl-CoA dehydrogenase family protein [candidate division Zixibacteria bacterium]|nr:acyl-CoA dehydrogenase family protein [candidate division Zixibacteria bacterium]